MDQQNKFTTKKVERRFSMAISSPRHFNQEVEDQKFNHNEIISLDSDDENGGIQEEIRNTVQPNVNTDTIVRTEFAQPLRIQQPVGQSMPPNQPVLQLLPLHQQIAQTLPRNVENQEQTKAYEQFIEVITQLTDAVKSLKKKFEKSIKTNKRKKSTKRSRKNKHYSSDSSSSRSSSSYERRRKKHRHRHHKSHRKRYSSSSFSETGTDRERSDHRHRYRGRHEEAKNSGETIQSHVGVSSTINITPPISESNFLSQNNNPSTSYQSGLHLKRKNPTRISRNERPIIDSEEETGSSTESEEKQRPKPINSSMRRKSIMTRPTVTTEDILRPPNTNKSLYFKSKKALTCQICKKYLPKRVVTHYKKSHEDSEVYVSRFSPAMAEKAKNEKHGAKRIKVTDKPQKDFIKAFCFFCETKKQFPPHYWMDHIRSHTGEYAYECDSCELKSVFNSHNGHSGCNGNFKKMNNDDLLRKGCEAYICRLCNYVQIDGDRLIQHLRTEHENGNDDQCEEIILLPAFKE
ncbi:serine/arginine repetitive matrix protein 4-like [Contarinia nasturtii]|uniref:serine/arginine repetitive matrix protein 4-like n=1 Tax=Contarinia nasturtii TaxID=265458 RepID=UPI0012D4614E|nr:serine/arginine repetitive matrix protein 4-like [Contarinia nasturtii]